MCSYEELPLQNSEENYYTLQEYVRNQEKLQFAMTKNNKQPIFLVQRKQRQYCVLVSWEQTKTHSIGQM